MKKYMVYMDDGRDCFKAAIPAANEKAARKYVEGNGEVIAIKDVTKDFPNRGVIGGNPNLIYPGQVLTIPAA